MPVISDADLASYLRMGSPDATVALFAGMASDLVEDVTGTLGTVPTRVKAIALEVAARAYRNPNGYSSETIDDYTYSRDTDTRQAGVYLTATEAAELATFTGTALSGPFTIPLGG